MPPTDIHHDFPNTQSTKLLTRIDDGGADALREARVHLMERYRSALVAYAANSRLATILAGTLADDPPGLHVSIASAVILHHLLA
jgi:hypothetical protein